MGLKRKIIAVSLYLIMMLGCISIMKHIICSNFQMKSRYWKKHIANILILKEVIYGEVISIFKVNAFR